MRQHLDSEKVAELRAILAELERRPAGLLPAERAESAGGEESPDPGLDPDPA